MTDIYVTRHEGETLEDTYRRSDGDEFGYLIPEALIERIEVATAEHQAAVEAIREHITRHGVPEVEIDEDDL